MRNRASLVCAACLAAAGVLVGWGGRALLAANAPRVRPEPATSKPAPLDAVPFVPSLPPVSSPPPPGRDVPDEGVVLVGGVAVPVPPDSLRPGPVRPAAALQPVPPTPPAPPALPPGVVTDEPPVRPLAAPRPLPLTELPPAPIAGPAPLLQSPAAVAPLPPPPVVAVPAVPLAPPKALPLPLPLPAPGSLPDGEIAGPIDVGGVAMPFNSLARLIDGRNGPPEIGGGCATCGGSCAGGSCRAGKKPCEPFPAHTAAGRVIGLIYENVCCPDPCYKPRWEAITAAAFFVDAPRPVTQTRVRWDYGRNLTFPDRGEFFWARADGMGRGPKPNPPARGVPGLDYHEIYLDQEVATGGGAGSVTVSQPYRSVNPTPFAESAAGFGDLQITAKSILFDSELFLFAFQMRTYIPTASPGKGLGTGHVSLEPGLIAGIRVGPDTYAVAQVEEWIPLGGDKDYMGAALRYNFAFNHVLWRPVKDVQFIGTLELQGISFQDGAFTEATLGPLQKLSGQTALSMGVGGRLHFCDKFDAGVGYAHGITGKYLVQDMLRTEFRYRY